MMMLGRPAARKKAGEVEKKIRAGEEENKKTGHGAEGQL